MTTYIRTPYTYLIGWSTHNKWYYGVRYAKNCHPKDLWVTYFTSSSSVKKMREILGEPDVIQVRKLFDCPSKACTWEVRVLQRLKVPKNKNFLNGHAGGHGYNALEQSRKSTIGMCTVYDEAGNKLRLPKTDQRIKSGELSGNRKGRVTVIDQTSGVLVDISVEEYKQSKDKYKHYLTGIKNPKSAASRKGKAAYIIDGATKIIDVEEAKRFNLDSVRKNTAPFKCVSTGERLILNVTDPRVISGEFVGVMRGVPINRGCAIDNRKEYTLSNFFQHLKKIDRKKVIKTVYTCVCDIETKVHYQKFAWNRYFGDSFGLIEHTVKNSDCFPTPVERFA
jgi:hypothetical protein